MCSSNLKRPLQPRARFAPVGVKTRFFMIGFFHILCANVLISAVYLGVQAVGGAVLGAKVEEVNLFFGGPILKVRIGKIRLGLGFFPTGGSVKFDDEFEAFSPSRRIGIACCGLGSYVLISLLCLGLGGALHQVGSGYGELFRGALSPLGVGANLVAKLADGFQNDSYRVGLGVLAAKFFAFNSLPLGTLSGGFVVGCLLEMLGVRSKEAKARFQNLQWIGVFVAFLLVVAWTVAFLAALTKVV